MSEEEKKVKAPEAILSARSLDNIKRSASCLSFSSCFLLESLYSFRTGKKKVYQFYHVCLVLYGFIQLGNVFST